MPSIKLLKNTVKHFFACLDIYNYYPIDILVIRASCSSSKLTSKYLQSKLAYIQRILSASLYNYWKSCNKDEI